MSLDAGWPRVETWMALVRGSAPNMASDDVAGIILCVRTQRVAGGESHAGREGPEPRGTWRRDGERGRRRRRRRVLELELAQPFRDLVGHDSRDRRQPSPVSSADRAEPASRRSLKEGAARCLSKRTRTLA